MNESSPDSPAAPQPLGRPGAAKTEERQRGGGQDTRLRVDGDAIGPFVWLCDSAGDVQFANDAWFEFTGQDSAALLGSGWADAVHPAEREQIRAGWQKAVRSNQTFETRVRYQSSSGAYRPFILKASPIHDAGGNIERWLGVSTDLDPDWRGQDSFEAQTRSILETAVEGIVTIDATGMVESFNPAAERIFGYSGDEVIGRNVRMLMPEPDHSQHDGYLANYLATGERKIIGIGREVQGRRKDGTTFPMELAVSEYELHGRTFFTGMIRDIAERKDAEEALRRQHEFNESMIETAQAIILVLDTQGRIVRINSFMEKLTGFSRAEVQGTDWFTKFLPRRDWPRIRDVFQTAVAGAEVKGIVNPILTKGGIEREIAWWGKALKDDNGVVTGVLSVGHDLTELKEARQKALQAERLAGIGQMMTGLAHESRNALQRAQACLDMLELDLTEQSELLDLTGRARKALNELHRLYEEVRSYAAPVTLETRECALSDAWEQAWTHLQEVRHDKNIRFAAHFDGTSLRCRVDPQRLEQVFRNIFENAIAASPDMGEIVLECADADIDGRAAARISIRDNGAGLTPEQQANILEPFFTTKTKGTGLGMPIAKRIVEAHGGTIDAKNADPRGAEIVVTLPREPS